MKYIISTLGCKVNQYETQAMETLLQQQGHSRAVPGELADAVIINTCAVTAESGRKSRQTIRSLKEENPGAVVAVCGCYSQISAEDVASLGADVIFGAAQRAQLVAAVEQAVASGRGCTSIDKPFQRRDFEQLPAGAVPGRTRAMLKIQDGCVNFCSYCIIPYTRGRLRSLPMEAAVAETKKLHDQGFKEIVLTGIEVASYGLDLPGKPGLADVICAVAEAAPGMRIRLGSLEPTVITEDFCRRLAETGRLCRHFHLSLQSGCDEALRRMNRRYDTARYLESVALLRAYFSGVAVTTDLITGFPGETEEEFEKTLAFLRRCAFAQIHVFPYSIRPGTRAAAMEQVPKSVKEARAARAGQVAAELHEKYLRSCVGQIFPVLFEQAGEDGCFVGHAPNYMEVAAAGENLHNCLRSVRITGVDGSVLKGEILL